jgi:hypothetical protein
MSIRDKIKPEDFQTREHYWDTFDNSETESSALWVIKFLQHRNAAIRLAGIPVLDNGWAPFTYDEINSFYRSEFNQTSRDISFNRLVEGTHHHTSASPDPPADKVCLVSRGGVIGYSHICKNDHSLEIEKRGIDPSRLDSEDLIHISDKFIRALAKHPRMFVKGMSSDPDQS